MSAHCVSSPVLKVLDIAVVLDRDYFWCEILNRPMGEKGTLVGESAIIFIYVFILNRNPSGYGMRVLIHPFFYKLYHAHILNIILILTNRLGAALGQLV